MHPNSVTACITVAHLFLLAHSFIVFLYPGHKKGGVSSDFCSFTKYL